MSRITRRGAGSGVPIDQGLALLCAFEDEKAVWAKAFTSKRDAIDAARAASRAGGVRVFLDFRAGGCALPVVHP
jgi:hypothetical protein